MADATQQRSAIELWRWPVLALFALICAWLVPGISQLRNDDDVLAFLPPKHEDVVAFREVAAAFGMLEVGLVGLEPQTGAAVDPDNVERIRELVDRLESLDGTRVVLGFPDLPHPEIVDDGLIVAPLVPKGLDDPAEIRTRVLRDSKDAVGNFVSADGRRAAVLVFLRPRKDNSPEAFEARAEILRQIRDTVHAYWPGEAYYTGAPFIEQAAASASRTDIERLSPLVILVLVVTSAGLLRSVTAALMNLVLTGAGVAIVIGAHGRFGEPLTIVSSSMPVMMVALGGAFGMHILAGYQRQSGTPPQRADATRAELWWPVTLSALTTAVAFFALYVMPQAPMRRFGVVAGSAMLLLLALSLFVLPALLSLLPAAAIPTRKEIDFPLPPRPPSWALLIVGLVAIGFATRLKAEPDTGKVFDTRSETAAATNYFDEHFDGSIYLQIAVDADLNQAEVLRALRDMSEDVKALDGVTSVRSLIDPVEVLNEALGGRAGVPENSERAARVLTYLVGHPAMAQLMKDDLSGALIHIKLAPADGDAQVELARKVREIVDRYDQTINVASVEQQEVALAQRERIAERLSARLEQDVPIALLDPNAPVAASPMFLQEITKLRDEALDPEEGVLAVAVPESEREALTPELLITPRGKDLQALLSAKLPTAAAGDPEGIVFAAEHLAAWIDEAAGKFRVEGQCAALDLEPEQCELARPLLSELKDEQWRAPPEYEGPAEIVPFHATMVGQPLIGAAFAQSVTTSLWQSTVLSLAALAVVLLMARVVVALVPALWTLALTAGCVALLGQPISVASSMVACIAVGAGVDFAIHLVLRARAMPQQRNAPERAVKDLGGVAVVSALQLGLAFLVLIGSTMPPLRHFGIGLAIALAGAALSAIWLVPLLIRSTSASSEDSLS